MNALKITATALIFAVVYGFCAEPVTTAQKMTQRQRINVSEIDQTWVLEGRLKLPLGTVVAVEGTIIDGASLKIKGFDAKSLLRIEKVEGKQVSEPHIFEVEYFQKKGKPLKLGSKFQLIGYETGRFIGVPSGAFNHIRPVASEGYGFRTSFVILTEKASSNKK